MQTLKACTYTLEGPRRAESKTMGVGGQGADTNPPYWEKSLFHVCWKTSPVREPTFLNFCLFQKDKGVQLEKGGKTHSLQYQILFQGSAFSLNQMKSNSQDTMELVRSLSSAIVWVSSSTPDIQI